MKFATKIVSSLLATAFVVGCAGGEDETTPAGNGESSESTEGVVETPAAKDEGVGLSATCVAFSWRTVRDGCCSSRTYRSSTQQCIGGVWKTAYYSCIATSSCAL